MAYSSAPSRSYQPCAVADVCIFFLPTLPLQADIEDDPTGGLGAFLSSMDMGDFTRLFTKAGKTLDAVAGMDQAEMARLGLPSGARRKIWNTLHPS